MRHADGQRDRAAGAALDMFADVGQRFIELGGRVMGGDFPDGLLVDRKLGGGGIDVVILRDRQGGGGDEGDDADEAFHEHRAVADGPGVGLLVDHLGRGARGDQGMEAGDGAAHDGDEEEGEDGPGHDRAAAQEVWLMAGA